jgi:hypothetical protein
MLTLKDLEPSALEGYGSWVAVRDRVWPSSDGSVLSNHPYFIDSEADDFSARALFVFDDPLDPLIARKHSMIAHPERVGGRECRQCLPICAVVRVYPLAHERFDLLSGLLISRSALLRQR